MILKKPIFASFRISSPKVSLRQVFQKSTAIILLSAGIGLPSEAHLLLSPAFAEETPRSAAPAQGSEQWMVGVYQEGKTLFDRGDYDGAQREWDKLSGSYDKNPSLKVIVDFMRKRIKEDPDTIKRGRQYLEQKSQGAQKQIEAAGKAKSKKSQTSDPEVSAFMDQARKDVTKQVRAANKPSGTLDSRRAQQDMLAFFAKGKQAYVKGDLQGALAAWDEAVTYLPPNSGARLELQKLKANSLKVAEKRNIPTATRAGSVTTSEDMKDFLQLVNARFRAEAQEGKARTAQRSDSGTQRQDAFDRSFEKSKLLYFQGQYEEAIDELNALAKYFPVDSEEAALIAGLRENYLGALKAQSEAKSVAPTDTVKLKSPAELHTFVEQAKRKFDTMIQEARSSRSVTERTAAEREQFVKSAFDRARSYFDQSRVEEGLSQLERIAPYVENETEILSLVDEVRVKQTEMEAMRETLEKPDEGEAKLNRAATKGISDFLKDATHRIDEQSRKIQARKKDTSAAVRERTRRLADIFQNARARYDAGDIDGALDDLSRMTSDVEDSAELDQSIQELRRNLEESRHASEELKALEDTNKDRWALPSELTALLAETQSNIKTHASDVLRKRDAARRTSEERKKDFDEAYAAGRAAYNAGNLETALREWEKIEPLVENGQDLSRSLAAVRADYKAAMEAERLSQASEGDGLIKLPDDFYELLNQTASQARARSQKAATDKQAVESTLAQKREAIARAYEAGRAAYNAGDLDKAVAQWRTLIPLVDDGASLGSMLDGLQRDYRAAKQAVDEAAALGKRPIDRMVMPVEMNKLLSDAQKQIETRGRDASARKQALEKSAADKKSIYETALAEGQAAYQAGDVEKAVEYWKKLLPIVEDSSALEAQLVALEKQSRETKALIAAAEKIQKSIAYFIPAEVSQSLVASQKQMDVRAREALTRKQVLDKSAAERKIAYEAAVLEGHTAYQAGDLEKAITAWKKLIPLTEDGVSLEAQLSDLSARSREAQSFVAAAEGARQVTKFSVPGNVPNLLSEAQKQMDVRAREASAKKEKLEKVSAEKKAAYETAVTAGREAYEAGDLGQAIDYWKKLAPLVEEGAAFDAQLDTLKDRFQEAQSLAAAVERLQVKPQLQIPTDIAKGITDTQKQTETKNRAMSARKEALEKAIADKKAIYDTASTEGREAYRAGDLQKAIASWRKLALVVEDGDALNAQLTALSDRLHEAQSQLSAVELTQKNSKFAVPADISKLTLDALNLAATRSRDAMTRRESLEKLTAEKKAVYEAASTEGRNAYQAGDFEKAIASWKKLTPIVEEGAEFEKQLLAAETELITARKVRADTDALAAQKVSFPIPADLSTVFSDISKKMQADIAQSRELTTLAQAKSAERHKRVETAIADGLGLYKNGLTSEALKKWESILPDLSDSDRLQKIISDLSRSEQELSFIQKTALLSEVDSKKQLAPPADLTKALEIAFATAKAKIEEAKNRQSQANNESVRRQIAVTESTQNGKLALARGDVETATAEWAKIAPYLENGQTLIPKLQELKTSYQQMTDTQKAAAFSEEQNLSKFKSLPEIEAFITEANLKYKNDTDTSKTRKEQADASFTEKQVIVEHTVRKARDILEHGDIPGATLEVMKLQAMVEDPITLQARLGSIQAAYEASLKAQTDAVSAVTHTNEMLFKSPPELALLLKDADQKVKELTQLANSQKLEAEQSLKEKEAFVQQSFEKGKNLYWQGKLEEALAEWDNMAPLLENGGRVKEVTGRYEETLHIQRQAREMTERRNEKFQTPAELQRLLNDAEKILSSQSHFASAQQHAAQDEISDRQAFINKTFQRGKALYEQGMIPDAIEEWEQLAPVLENGSKVKEFIDGVKSTFKGAADAKKGAEEAQARSIVAPQAPADLTRLLAEANQGLQNETQRSHDDRQKSEEVLREKQKMIDGIFQKGKTLYQAGRLEEAVDTWKTLLPFVDDNSSIRQLIQQAEDSRRALMAERYETQNNMQAQAPKAMQFALEETNASLKDQIAQQQSARLAADLKAVVGTPFGQKPGSKALSLDAHATVAGSNDAVPFKLDEIEQMMLEYKVVTPEDLKKRRETLKSAATPTE